MGLSALLQAELPDVVKCEVAGAMPLGNDGVGPRRRRREGGQNETRTFDIDGGRQCSDLSSADLTRSGSG